MTITISRSPGSSRLAKHRAERGLNPGPILSPRAAQGRDVRANAAAAAEIAASPAAMPQVTPPKSADTLTSAKQRSEADRAAVADAERRAEKDRVTERVIKIVKAQMAAEDAERKRQAEISAMWDRAIARTFGIKVAGRAERPQRAADPSQAVWDKAIAAVFPPARSASATAAAPAEIDPVAAMWERAIAANNPTNRDAKN